MDNHLRKLENESVYILRQSYRSIKNIAMLWSLGKDSNVMVWLAFKAFLGKIPFPLVHVDTGKKFKEMYHFREKYEKEWKLKLIRGNCPPIEKIDSSLPPAARSAARKTDGSYMRCAFLGEPSTFRQRAFAKLDSGRSSWEPPSVGSRSSSS